jgi:hypothetical protein
MKTNFLLTLDKEINATEDKSVFAVIYSKISPNTLWKRT